MIDTKAKLTCPHCKETLTLQMPLDFCLIRYQCEKCEKYITPKKGDCCIFCSYSNKKCPPMQK
jgi:hypothetical protein